MRFLVLLMSLTLASCELPYTTAEAHRLVTASTQARRTGICEVHQFRMVRTTVKVTFGLEAPDLQYYRAMTRYFPNAEAHLNGGCDPSRGPRTGRVYICPECQRGRLHWARMHPWNSEAKSILHSQT